MNVVSRISRPISQIYLIGMMGGGKTTTAHLLAEKMSWAVADTDKLIESQGLTISDIFVNQGERAFRQIERDILITCSETRKTVIATGGGLPCYHDNMNYILEHGFVIYLKASAETLIKRLESDYRHRPLLSADSDTRADNIKTLLKKRKSFYERAHYIVEADRDDPSAIVDKIHRILP